MRKVILIGLLFGLLTFIASAVLSLSALSDQRELDKERSHAFHIVRTLESLVGTIINAETAWSNYQQTKEAGYLQTFHSAIGETEKYRDELKNIYSGANGRFDELFILINSRLDVLKELLGSVTRGTGPETEVEILRREELIHNELIQAVQNLEKQEDAKIVDLDVQTDRVSRRSTYSLLGGTLLSVVVFSGMFALLYRELRERKRLEQVIKRQAHFDPLTGLRNRLSFIERLDYAIIQAGRSRQRLAIMYLDVDRFKDINDALGHEAGDRLLKEVAARLRASVREADTLARIGGDEFNLLVANVPDKGTNAALIAEKIVASFVQPFSIMGQEVRSSCSLGISIYPEDAETAGGLLVNADVAMYHAKEQGGNNYKFYNPFLERRTQERVMLEKSIRHSLEKNELTLHYQPLMDLRKKKIVCAEALVRWRHPEKGLLYPLDFIPMAEGIGFISSLDEWVLRTACAEFSRWRKSGQARICLAVNISSRAFKRPDFAGVVSRILIETGLDPRDLELEVSEQVAMENIEKTAAKMDEYSRVGVGLAIDHFGAGYCSLNKLKLLSLRRIKIDKSFIKGIDSSRNDRAIIKAMIVMAHNMGVTVVAEGVENREQMRFLRNNGCDEVQGYHVSGPKPLEEFTRFAGAYWAG